MVEYIEKIENLKSAITDSETVKEIKQLETKIKNNLELRTMIEKYNLTKNEEIKENIYSYQIIGDYKRLENELNFIILEINQKLKEVGS